MVTTPWCYLGVTGSVEPESTDYGVRFVGLMSEGMVRKAVSTPISVKLTAHRASAVDRVPSQRRVSNRPVRTVGIKKRNGPSIRSLDLRPRRVRRLIISYYKTVKVLVNGYMSFTLY